MKQIKGRWAVAIGLIAGCLAALSASGQVIDRTRVHASAVEQPILSTRGIERHVALPDGGRLSLDGTGTRVTLRRSANGGSQTWSLPSARMGSTVTRLPSGRVLIWGGTDNGGHLQSGGLWFDPELKTLGPVEDVALSARAWHTATVLTDGRVLFVGGRSGAQSAELWDERTGQITPVAGGTGSERTHHWARLRSDGLVQLTGGRARLGHTRVDTLFDPIAGRFSATNNKEVKRSHTAGLAGSLPAAGAQTVPTDARLSVRFTQPVRMGDLSASNITLVGPNGATPLRIVPVEDGRLVFLTPHQELFPGSAYTVMLDGLQTVSGQVLPLIAIDFKTAVLASEDAGPSQTLAPVSRPALLADTTLISTGQLGMKGEACLGTDRRALPCAAKSSLRDGVWTPGRDSTDSRWRVPGRQPELLRTDILAKVTQALGFTTVIGQILRVDGAPVAHVDVSIGASHALTDAAGHFTVYNAPAGRQELVVDGTTANAAGVEYGQFVVGVDVNRGQLTQLPYTMYLPRITARDKVKITSPLVRDLVVTHPDMPGLQVQIPAGTVIRDRKGRLVRELAIVPTPVNRAPFPVADNYPMYFTLEPGGAVIQGLNPEAAQGVRVFYPNYDNHPKGTQANFWIYDPAEGWRVYGQGRVTSDGSRFAPEAGVALHQTMGGSYSIASDDPATESGRPECNEACGSAGTGEGATGGDPIDLKTGEFFYSETDLVLRDIVPITLSRHYRPHDLKKRVFGVGTAANFSHKLSIAAGDYNNIQLVAPSGVPIKFVRISGTGAGGELREIGSTTAYNRASLIGGWEVVLRDGSSMRFGQYAPNLLQWTKDRYGNRTEYVYDAGLLTKIISPSGRSLTFDYDSQSRIEQVTDHTGRSWSYAYDSDGLLKDVVYPDQTARHYTYKKQGGFPSLTQHRIETITDQRGHRLLLNEFESVGLGWSGRVIKQTQADGGIYTIQYDHQDGATIGTLVTQPDGSKRRVVFEPNSPYPKTDTVGYGTSLAQMFQFERNAQGRITARIDPLGRRTEYQYDGEGQTTQVTYLAGTAQARSAQLTYTALGELASVTDPLQRTMTLSYNNRCLSSIIDALARTTTFTCNAAGRLTSVTNPLNQTTVLGYTDYELTSVTDPLGRTQYIRYDTLGRVVATQDPEGNLSRREYDLLDRTTKILAADGEPVEMDYDANGNVLAVLMPHGNGITYTYDTRDRMLTRTDSLSQVERWTYDTMDRIDTYTDRKGQITGFDYDALGRTTVSTYQDGSTLTAAYDAGNRLRTLTDSLSGSLGWNYDDFDQVIESLSPQGTIGYTYDAASRRVGMTPASQPAVEYQYDPANRLTRILQGSEIVDFDYDDADRRIQTTLPNGVQSGFAYNAAGQLTGIAWLKPDSTALGDLGYGYSGAGRLIARTGSFASETLPVASSGTNAFDDNHRQTQYNGQALTYDANGNLTSDGTRTYIWNARDQLTQIKQGANTLASFQYDALGRRYAKSEAGATTQYLYDGPDAVQEVQGGSVNPILTGLGIDERYARNDSGGRTYFLTDKLGSTRALTNASGAVVQRYDYTAYGQTTQTASGFSNPYQYTGREQDVSGLYYYRARYYQPGMARFISEDQIGLAGGLNTYAYVGGDPLNYRDPSGNCPICVVAFVIWTAVEVGMAVYEMYDTARTLLDPCASGSQKVAAVGLLAAGLVLPGGGYTKADDLAEAIAKKASGRSGRQARLRELVNDDKLSSADRGWIKQEMNSIERGQRSSIRNPPGKDLAHERGREAAKGYDYSHSNLQDRDLHRTQHKYDDFGRANAERPVP